MALPHASDSQVEAWRHFQVWPAVTGGNTPVCKAAKSQWPGSVPEGVRISMGSWAPHFSCLMHTEAPEAPTLIPQQGSQVSPWETSQRGASLDLLHQPWPELPRHQETGSQRSSSPPSLPWHFGWAHPAVSCWLNSCSASGLCFLARCDFKKIF